MSQGFSVVIPAFNYGHCVERAVRSVLKQTCPAFEVIVINDGSSDDTETVMQALVAEGDERLRYVSQSNQGLSAVRNRGVEESRYPWLVFLDADDEMCPGALAAYQACATENPSARLLIGGHVSATADRQTPIAPLEASAERKVNFANYLNKKLTISNGACAMHQSLFETVRYDPALRHTEDLPVFAHILANYDVACFPAPVAVIHKHAGSMRHDVDAALRVGLSLETSIFDDNGLPDWAATLRKPYRARRLISLIKLCERAGRYRDVRQLYRALLRVSPLQALSPRYLRRFLRSLWQS